jgi:lipopolysaccharide transport system permease protein
VPARFRWVYALNPLTGIIEVLRAALLGTSLPPTTTIGSSMAVGLALFVSGVLYFKHTERYFADVV